MLPLLSGWGFMREWVHVPGVLPAGTVLSVLGHRRLPRGNSGRLLSTYYVPGVV